jgi:catechol-2,3-dioxygenase
MNLSLNRVILFVQDVNRLKYFYQSVFNLTPAEEIINEWVVFRTGCAELALHRAGLTYRNDDTALKVNSNAKLVFETDADLTQLREELIQKNVVMREIKSFDPDYLLCDGEDPERNVFQLKQKK